MCSFVQFVESASSHSRNSRPVIQTLAGIHTVPDLDEFTLSKHQAFFMCLVKQAMRTRYKLFIVVVRNHYTASRMCISHGWIILPVSHLSPCRRACHLHPERQLVCFWVCHLLPVTHVSISCLDVSKCHFLKMSRNAPRQNYRIIVETAFSQVSVIMLRQVKLIYRPRIKTTRHITKRLHTGCTDRQGFRKLEAQTDRYI